MGLDEASLLRRGSARPGTDGAESSSEGRLEVAVGCEEEGAIRNAYKEEISTR